MLKLKHLFDNRDLADMLLAYWDWDSDNREILDRFRISANAVYPFYYQERLQFLRFSPEEEKSAELIRAEVDFLNYLKGAGYPSVQLVRSQSGQQQLSVPTPWGRYSAVVFSAAGGEPLTEVSGSDEIYYGLGQSLARLHSASAAYQPGNCRRPDWKEILDWCRTVFDKYQAPKKAVLELVVLRKHFSSLRPTGDNYGLIHFDFETDNVFYDARHKVFTPIDFDDCHYHWYAMDIVKTLRSIQEDLPDKEKTTASQSLISGYQSIRPVDEKLLASSSLFIRYTNIVTYARIWRSIYEKWDHEPDWMIKLREHLNEHLKMLEWSFAE